MPLIVLSLLCPNKVTVWQKVGPSPNPLTQCPWNVDHHCTDPEGHTNITYQSGPQVKLTHRECFTITFALVSCCGRLRMVVFLFKWVVY